MEDGNGPKARLNEKTGSWETCGKPGPRTVDPVEHEVEIVGLLASPLHRYQGRPKDGPVPFDGPESREQVEIRANKGIVGDRFFNQQAHRLQSVTIIAIESLEAIGATEWAKTRRNIVLRGYPVDELRGVTFSLGGVRFTGHRPANPCAWMDEQLAPGAFAGLRTKGGIRLETLSDGFLSRGKTTLLVEH